MIVLAHRTDNDTWQHLQYASAQKVPLTPIGLRLPADEATWDRVLEIVLRPDGNHEVLEYVRAEPEWRRVPNDEESEFVEVDRRLIEQLSGEALAITEGLAILNASNTKVKAASEFADKVYRQLRSQL